MKKLRILPIALVVSMLPALTGCGPKYASKQKILRHAQVEARGENLEIVRELEEHTYLIRSLDRDLSFNAWTYSPKMSCDGADFGYSGQAYIQTDYTEAVYRYWFEDAKALLDVDGFDWVRFNRYEDQASTFKFYVDADVPQEDLDKIEDFMFALREILRKEQEFHTSNIDICYNVVIMKHFPEDGEKSYHRCAGNDGYNTRITSETPDIELDIERMGHEANAWIENTEPDKACGVIMMYNEDNTD